LPRKREPRVFLWVFGITGIGCFLLGIHHIVTAIQTQSWQQVPGQILVSERYTFWHEGWRTKIVYAYEPGGARLTNNVITAGAPFAFHSDGTKASQYSKRYPVGRRVTVFCDAQHPEKSVLEPGFVARSLWLLPILALLWAYSGYFFDVVLPRITKK
jgi:hypothetical protein